MTNLVKNKYAFINKILFLLNIIGNVRRINKYILVNIVIFSSEGATIEFLFIKPYFTAYKAESIVDLDSLISKL